MNAYSKSPWTNGLTISTILFVVLIVIVIVYLSYLSCSMNPAIWAAVLLIVTTLLWAIIVAPKGVSLDENGNITVHLLACKISIAKENIVKVCHFPSDKSTIRLIGSGGVFGYMGLFKNTGIGVFSSYATDFDKSYVIYRKNKRPIVVTIDDLSIIKALNVE